MSSVVISGDTSGAITLAAPAVAGTNTINLPAAAGTVMVSGNMPAFSAYQSAASALSAGTTTKVLFDQELFDTNNNFASSRFTPTVAGYYQVNGTVFVNSTVSILFTILNHSAGSTASKSGTAINIAGQSQAASSASGIMYFNGSTDYVEVWAFSSSAVNTLGNEYTHFTATLIRSA